VRVAPQAGLRVVTSSWPVDVRQTVGSGDVFAGALCAEVAGGAELVDACDAAAAAAAAWISSSASLPGEGLADAVGRASARSRLPIVTPERLRAASAVTRGGAEIGSVALVDVVCRSLDSMGASNYRLVANT
jgi:hypothetical protein